MGSLRRGRSDNVAEAKRGQGGQGGEGPVSGTAISTAREPEDQQSAGKVQRRHRSWERRRAAPASAGRQGGEPGIVRARGGKEQ